MLLDFLLSQLVIEYIVFIFQLTTKESFRDLGGALRRGTIRDCAAKDAKVGCYEGTKYGRKGLVCICDSVLCNSGIQQGPSNFIGAISTVALVTFTRSRTFTYFNWHTSLLP